MDRGTISVNVTFKKPLDSMGSQRFGDIQNRINTAKSIIKKLMDKGDPIQIQFPFSSNQPVNVPIAITQSDNAATIQGVVSLNSIQISKKLNKTGENIITTDEIARTMVEIKDTLFREDYDKLIPIRQIQSITISSSMTKDKDSFEAIKRPLEHTEYKGIISNINPMGFNFSYFKKSDVDGATGETVAYAPVVNLVMRNKGTLIAFSIACGGIDFGQAAYIDLDINQVEKFISSTDKNTLLEKLNTIYGQ